MKSWLTLALVLLGVNAQALEGKIQLVNKFHNEGKDYRPMFGLNLHQKLVKEMAANLWVGGSQEPTDLNEDVMWGVVKGNIDLYIHDLVVAPGYQYQVVKGEDFKKSKEYFFIKLEYKLF